MSVRYRRDENWRPRSLTDCDGTMFASDTLYKTTLQSDNLKRIENFSTYHLAL